MLVFGPQPAGHARRQPDVAGLRRGGLRPARLREPLKNNKGPH